MVVNLDLCTVHDATQIAQYSLVDFQADRATDAAVKKAIGRARVNDRFEPRRRGRMRRWIVDLDRQNRHPNGRVVRKCSLRREWNNLVVEAHRRYSVRGVQFSGVRRITGSVSPFRSAAAVTSSNVSASATTRVSSADSAIHRCSGALASAARRDSEAASSCIPKLSSESPQGRKEIQFSLDFRVYAGLASAV